jgi:hypothetical protein
MLMCPVNPDQANRIGGALIASSYICSQNNVTAWIKKYSNETLWIISAHTPSFPLPRDFFRKGRFHSLLRKEKILQYFRPVDQRQIDHRKNEFLRDINCKVFIGSAAAEEECARNLALNRLINEFGQQKINPEIVLSEVDKITKEYLCELHVGQRDANNFIREKLSDPEAKLDSTCAIYRAEKNLREMHQCHLRVYGKNAVARFPTEALEEYLCTH